VGHPVAVNPDAGLEEVAKREGWEILRFEKLGERLRVGGAPSEIVRLYAAEDAKRGRNDPCTCGSGMKWKQCHGSH